MRVWKIIFPLILYVFFTLNLVAQKANWQNLDLGTDSVFGISTERMYSELKLPAVKKDVLVGVIDSGIDTAHEDLKAILWHNPKEIDFNAADDDHNGYTDDRWGWDFIGGAQGDVHQDNLELTRAIREMRQTNDTSSNTYHELLKKYVAERNAAKQNLDGINNFIKAINDLLSAMHDRDPSRSDLQAFEPINNSQGRVKNYLLNQLSPEIKISTFLHGELGSAVTHYQSELDYQLNTGFDPRYIVGDDYYNSKEKYYGNNDVTGPDALHGTHVAGIIGAVRDNNVGIKGVADHVRIITVRAVPDGDERDKDIANAIRYAVDQGAKVINMSFGKAYTHDKAIVDEAVKYAMKKDVLLVAAAGNEGINLDNTFSYPNPIYADGSGMASGWITVGASSERDDSSIVAPFSNYGKARVDVFAPGVQIYSTIPGSQYTYESGTSMAAPVVTGLAAIIRAHYPKLKATQVKEIILKSVIRPAHSVRVRENGVTQKVFLSDISVSGGIVNAYQALQLAATY